MKARPLIFLQLVTSAMLLSGCLINSTGQTTAGEDAFSAAIETAVVAALPTQATPVSALPTLTPAPTDTPVPQTYEGVVAAETLNLRGGPSMLHNIISQYKKGDVVQLLARAPGNEWVKVLGKDNKIGWMYITHLTVTQAMEKLPIFVINESLVIKGQVVDASGNGLPGIQVEVTRMGGAQRVRVTGISMADGTFYAYAPIEYQGTWLAAIIGVDCKSPIVDANCRYAGAFYPTEGVNLTLPAIEDIVITYK
ncbi:MAG: hypothetical protein C0391_08690 [Anaerolinea sp.]|nr:hypothetical protein [Anaerolinea sp.]